MSIQPVQKSILYNKTCSSQRLSRNAEIPSSSKDIDDNPRTRKKAKKQSNSREFDIYKDIDVELRDRNTRESSIISNSPKRPRITVEIPRKQPFQEIDQNIARPNDHYSTIARLPDRIVSLSSLRKWQKAQPNDHTSKVFKIFKILIILTNYLYRSMASG